jgi:predicted permease
MLGRLLRRVWYLLNRRQLERELEREMAAHRAEMGEPNRFGGTLRLREQSADVWGWAWLDDLWHDLRYGARQLRRAPGFALVAILTLAVGIGANTTAFAILNSMLLAELPVPEPRMLRQFEWAGRRTFSEAAFRYVRDHASGFSALTCITDQTTATIGRADSHEQGRVVWVSGGFFQTFGSTTAIGRPLTPADDRPGAPPVAVISYEAWQRQFGAAASVVGSAVTVGDWPVTIVGVAQRGFSTSLSRRPPDLTLPMSVSTRSWAADGSQRERSCRIVGRLSQGRPEELTRQESEMLLRRSGLRLPIDSEPGRLRERLRLGLRPVARGIDEMRPGDLLANNVPQITGTLFLLLSVLIVPCANVAAMLLARAITRRPEIVTRLALGASRTRLIRQLLTEGALLSVFAGAIGMLTLWSIVATDFLQVSSMALDSSVLTVTAGICALATLSFGLAPALNATRGDLASRIRDSSGGTSGRLRGVPGTLLVAAQVVVSCVLLAVAALQARTLLASTMATATEPERVLLVEVDPGRRGTDGASVEDVVSLFTSMPGVVSAGAASSDGVYGPLCEKVDARTGREIPVWLYAMSPGYVATMKVPLHGRDFVSSDNRAGGAAVINDALARSLFGRVDPVGQRLPLEECSPREATRLLEPMTVVGVVADEHVSETIYLPYEQLASAHPVLRQSSMTFVARSAGNANVLARPVRQAMQQAGVTIHAMHTQAERLAQRGRGLRTLTAVYVLLGLLVTAQAAFGLYGTVSHFVNGRTAEIGIRVVLGARAPDVVRLVIRQALAPVLIGLLLGLACSPLVARVMQAARVIGEIGWGELLAISTGIAIVMLTAFVAASTPVWRISRIDPAAALREE